MIEQGSRARLSSARTRLDRSVFLAQLLVGAATLLLVGVSAVAVPEILSSPVFFLGVILIVVATALAGSVTWGRLPKETITLLPVLDVIGIGLIHGSEPRLGASFLFVFPVIWISTHFGARGAAGSVFLATVMLWGGTSLGDVPPVLSDVPRLAVIPTVLAFVAITTHLTTRRAAAQRVLLTQQAGLFEAALRRSRRQQQTLDEIFNAVDFGVVAFDSSAKVSFVNRAQREIVAQFGPGEGPVADVVYTDDRVTPYAATNRPFARALRGEAIDRLSVWVGEPGQQQAALLVSTRPIFDDRGNYDGGVMVSRDVTAEVRAVQARDDLIASVSHELRTPLTSIIGYLDLVLDDDGIEPAVRRRLDVASKNSERLLAIVSDLLTAASESKEEPQLNLAPCDLSAIVTDAIESASLLAAQRDITFELDALPVVELEADAFRLRQVVDNIISNAIKYNVASGHITVSLLASDTSVVLRVGDTGRGMTVEEQKNLFDPFYRADSVRGGSVHGTGLGLSISRDIMRRHRGDLRLESVKGKGSTAIATLPISR
ncbi:MAG TPA: ATP-binding protein [Cryobacterium sp.]|nr:ATP-binding protein [Cryobacterium sp.]